MMSFPNRIAASLLMLGCVLQPQAGEAQSKPAATLQHITITRTGKGPPVILIPGLATPRDVYAGVAPELARTHSVYLVQVNGFGSSPTGNLEPGIIAGVVTDLDGYIVQNKLTGVAVVGHSMGGLIALELAKAHPGDAGKLMIVDTLPYIGEIFLPGVTVAMVEPKARAIRDGAIASYGKPNDGTAATTMANSMALKPDSRAKVTAWIKAADPRVTGQALYEDMTTDLRPDMATIQTPITLVYPWSDQLPKDKADAFYHAEYAKAPNVTYVPIGDSAHFVMLDQPAAFQMALEAFLAR